MSAKKTDVYAEVTATIVAALEAGTVPWRRPWRTDGSAMQNPVSGTVYRGINPFLLDIAAMSGGFSSPYWVTFKQAQARGGNVRAGEKSTMVVFWKRLVAEDKDTGRKKVIPMLRHFRVFNAEQCEGIEWPEVETIDFEPIERCAEIVAGMPNAPSIGHGGNRAFYAPAMDHVQLPSPEQFVSAEAYYGTAFHELAHSTGHQSRLDRPELRDMHQFGDDCYSKEELTAEMTAAMLSGVAGISAPLIENSAAYVANWLKALRNDVKLAVAAAGRAQRAADCIRGITYEKD